MSDKKSQFIRKYQRSSKSPWLDDSTVLLYANTTEKSGEMEIDFSQYIYLHRDAVGSKALGISISKSILDENPEFEERYLSGIEMYAMLLLYIDEIAGFCEVFAEEFANLFLLDPKSYFEVAEVHWLSIINKC